jgi:hypothetical protein
LRANIDKALSKSGSELLDAVTTRKTLEKETQSQISTVLGEMGKSRVEDVKKLVSPMFYLFDFAEFSQNVYEQIVQNFERGIVT